MAYPFVQAAARYGTRKGPVMAFVVHMAEGGGTVGFLSRPNDRGVSVHYVIEYDGTIVQMVRELEATGSINPSDIRITDDPAVFGATVRKAVMGAWDHDPNAAVISVEIEGFAATGPRTAQQVALKRLVTDVRSRYPRMGLLGHRDFQDYKACPGKLIPWSDLGGHGPYTEGDGVIIVTQTASPGTFRIPPNTEIVGTQFADDGSIVHKTWAPRDTGSAGTYSHTASIKGIGGNPFVLADAGYFAGFYLSAPQVGAMTTSTPVDCTDVVTVELGKAADRAATAVRTRA